MFLLIFQRDDFQVPAASFQGEKLETLIVSAQKLMNSPG